MLWLAVGATSTGETQGTDMVLEWKPKSLHLGKGQGGQLPPLGAWGTPFLSRAVR